MKVNIKINRLKKEGLKTNFKTKNILKNLIKLYNY